MGRSQDIEEYENSYADDVEGEEDCLRNAEDVVVAVDVEGGRSQVSCGTWKVGIAGDVVADAASWATRAS